MVYVEQDSVLVIHNQDTFYALQGLCPHQHLPLIGGQVWEGVLDCPWHHVQYDLRTGENLYPRRVYPLEVLPRLREQVAPLQVYPVRIVEESIQIGVL